jgi:hypothetical protein
MAPFIDGGGAREPLDRFGADPWSVELPVGGKISFLGRVKKLGLGLGLEIGFGLGCGCFCTPKGLILSLRSCFAISFSGNTSPLLLIALLDPCPKLITISEANLIPLIDLLWIY